MKVDTNDLVTALSISKRMGVRPSAIWNWASRYEDFPEPVFSEDRTTLWRWTDVRKWLDEHGREIPEVEA